MTTSNHNDIKPHDFYFGATLYSKEHIQFIEKLTEERKKAGITQIELCERLSSPNKTVPQKIMSDIEIAQRRVDVIEFLHLAKIIGFDPSEFIKEFVEQ